MDVRETARLVTKEVGDANVFDKSENGHPISNGALVRGARIAAERVTRRLVGAPAYGYTSSTLTRSGYLRIVTLTYCYVNAFSLTSLRQITPCLC